MCVNNVPIMFSLCIIDYNVLHNVVFDEKILTAGVKCVELYKLAVCQNVSSYLKYD